MKNVKFNGEAVELEIPDGAIITGIVAIVRFHTGESISSGFAIGVSEDMDPTVVAGLLHRATNINDLEDRMGYCEADDED